MKRCMVLLVGCFIVLAGLAVSAAPAAAHRPYDFREEEEQNEFRRMKELLENDTPESAAELRAILTRQLEREIAFTAARRTYFEAKCRRAEHSVKAWKSDPDRVVENHLKTVLASAAMSGSRRPAPGSQLRNARGGAELPQNRRRIPQNRR